MEENAGLLTEYEMLQGEINSNSQVTANVFAVTVTGVAALIGYGVSVRNSTVLLAPFALLLPSLWFVASQLESTTRIATYVRTFIEPHVDGLAWETRLDALRSDLGRPDSRYTLSITGLYGLLGAACLALAWVFVEPSASALIALSVATLVLGVTTAFVAAQCRRAFSKDCLSSYCEGWQRLSDAEEQGRGSGAE